MNCWIGWQTVKIYKNIDQNTDEWLALRAGKFTASTDFQQLVTGKKDTYNKLMRKKAAEKITGQLILNEYTNANMQRGNELEQAAIDAFQMETGLIIDQVGFVEGSEWYGCSPDGLIGEDAGIEIKCKDIHTHFGCFVDGYDTTYKWQIQGSLFVTGRKVWYFVSYNPHYVHLNKHLVIEKIGRDDNLIGQIKAGIDKGVADVKQLIETYGGVK